MELNKQSSIPLYHQLFEIFIQYLEDGIWKVGDRLPTEEELAKEYGVSRITVKQALNILKQEGKIERQSGKGTFVTHPKYEYNLRLSSGFSEYIPSGKNAKVEVKEWECVVPTKEVKDNLRHDDSSPVFVLRRVVLSENTPVVFQELFYKDYNLSEEDVRKPSLIMIFEPITSIRETLQPIALDNYEAKLLHVRPGKPAIRIDRIMFDSSRPVAFEKSLIAHGKIRIDEAVLTEENEDLSLSAKTKRYVSINFGPANV